MAKFFLTKGAAGRYYDKHPGRRPQVVVQERSSSAAPLAIGAALGVRYGIHKARKRAALEDQQEHEQAVAQDGFNRGYWDTLSWMLNLSDDELREMACHGDLLQVDYANRVLVDRMRWGSEHPRS